MADPSENNAPQSETAKEEVDRCKEIIERSREFSEFEQKAIAHLRKINEEGKARVAEIQKQRHNKEIL